MEQHAISHRELKRRKMLFILPLITLPFITLLFWNLGGGTMGGMNEVMEGKKGFNFNLPIPKFKEDSTLDKMSYYDKAVLDSLKLLEQIKKDPNYSNQLSLDDSLESWEQQELSVSIPKRKTALNSTSFKDKNEEKVYQKLKALQKAISKPAPENNYGQDMTEFENYGSSKEASEEIKNLEQMMSVMNEPQEADPELKQLGGMLENILDIQHPARVQERLKQSSENKRGKIYAVNRNKEESNITSLQQNRMREENILEGNSFYSVDEVTKADYSQNSIEAVIHETQTIVNGSIVKFRLSNDIYTQGVLIPKNSFLFGVAVLKGERLEIKITNIQYRNSIYSVELIVYDLDGIDGIYIPGAINRDVAKESADRSIQTLGLNGMEDSWEAQAAGMGIEAAKSLMSKKVKQIKVVVKAGYQVLLYDEKQKNLKP